jgi:hypothetical protein
MEMVVDEITRNEPDVVAPTVLETILVTGDDIMIDN